MIDIFQYQFIVNAIVAALLASVSCGIIGTYVVARKQVFLVGGVTHASFGGVGLGYMIGFSPLVGAILFSSFSAIIFEKIRSSKKINGDSAIAMIWSLGMALGIIFIYLTPGYAPDLNSYLFGDILTVTSSDITMMVAVSLITIVAFSIFYRLILAVSFDEEFAKSNGAPVKIFNYVMIVLSAVTIVSNIRVAGIILVLSLITVPQATSSLFFDRFDKRMVLAIVISFISIILGLTISYMLDIPSGATIIISLISIYSILLLIKKQFLWRKEIS